MFSNGLIEDIVERAGIPSSYRVEDVGNSVILPGLVDTHVHVNEPGRTEWEGFETATRAAAGGGITTIIDMPLNSSPVTTSVAALEAKIASARGKLHVDCAFHAGLVPGNVGALPALIESGVLGVKAFLVHSGIDEFPNATETDLRAAMPILADAGVPLLVHAELPDGGAAHATTRSYSAYLASHPKEWEHRAISLLIRLCAEFHCQTHIVHLSSADALPMIREAQRSGLPLTTETCPHYLVFSAEDIPDGDTRFKCAPPIRERANRERLWEGLREDMITCIVSDHSPCPPSLKLLSEGDFMRAWGGVASLQVGLPAVWTEASHRGFTLTDVARWMCSAPAQLVGLGSRKGQIAPGFDADFVVFNPDRSFTITAGRIHHRHKVTPYEGRQVLGVIERTYLRGRKIFDNGAFTEPTGNMVFRHQLQEEL